MANRTRRIFSFVFAMMMSFTVLSGCCSAREYKVGDSEGWTAKDDVYYSWAETDYKEFHVGDSLVFEYDPNINDVIHVSGALEYELCDYSSPKAIYNTGHDVVVLTEPGFHYFITSNQAQTKLSAYWDRNSKFLSPMTRHVRFLHHSLARFFLSERPTRLETRKDGKSTIATFITSGVRRNSFVLEMVCFLNTPTKSTTSTKSTVI